MTWVRASTPPAVDSRWLGRLFDRVGFAGQQCLRDKEVVGLQNPPVGRNQIAGAEFNAVAWNKILRRRDAQLPVSPHPHRQCDRAAQCLDRPTGAMLLHHVENDAQEHQRDDEDEAQHIAGEGRYR